MSESDLSLDARIENAQEQPWSAKLSLSEMIQNKWTIAGALFVFCTMVLLIIRPPLIFVDRGDEAPFLSWIRLFMLSILVSGAFVGLSYVWNAQ